MWLRIDSLIASAKLNGIDLEAYVRELFDAAAGLPDRSDR
jgi:hypothetical protein